MRATPWLIFARCVTPGSTFPPFASVLEAWNLYVAFIPDVFLAWSPTLSSILIPRFVTTWQVLTYTCDERLLRPDLKSKFVQLQASERTFSFVKAHPPHGLAGSQPSPS